MSKVRILPYRQGSRSASALAKGIGKARVLKLEGSKFLPKQGDLVVNWGNVKNPTHPSILSQFPRVLNKPESILTASNKLKFFQACKEAGNENLVPRFWTNKNDIPDDAFPIVCRTVLSGHSGDGIVLADTRDDLVPASLYVQYMKKKHEYRIHVGRRDVGGVDTVEVFSKQQKKRKLDVPNESVNWKIRNHFNGFVYTRENIHVPACVLSAAATCFKATPLDFGAVDVIYNEHDDKAYVLEINTAPGLEGTTIDDYVAFLAKV